MALKVIQNPNRRLSAEEAVFQIAEDAGTLRARCGLASPVLNTNAIISIDKEWTKLMPERGRRYAHYEIGHLFLREHLILSVKRSANLNADEEDALTKALGTIYYNPPQKYYLDCSVAAGRLAGMGDRATQISAAYGKELTGLDNSFNDARRHLSTSTFFNPMGDLRIFNRHSLESYSKFLASIAAHRYEPFYE